jgi:hypothetical protein
VFLKSFIWITFSSVFLTMEPAQELSFLFLMMMGSSYLLPFVHCASHSTFSSTQIQERLEKWFYSMVDRFVWGEVSCQ